METTIWKIPYTWPDTAALEAAGFPPLLAAVLSLRGACTPEQAERILSGGKESLHDPMQLLGMEDARIRILEAIERKEHVAVYGDYDVDGITSTCLLTDYLRSRGLLCSWYIPDRDTEGYGLNCAALQKLQDTGVTLVVTVDCGITAVEEAAFCRSIGLDLIITDHHECRNGAIPDACAVIDPKREDDRYPNPDLAGVGVAMKVACAVEGNCEDILSRYADLVAVGTIADVMPLTGENRYLVRQGLQMLVEDPRPGFQALLEDSSSGRSKVTASSVSFCLAPRLNAAGRLGQTAKAAELLLCSDRARALDLAQQLLALNKERQQIENEIWSAAKALLPDHPADEPIVLAHEGWHQGVIGIAASRLAEQFAVPAIIICLSEDNGKGSCRSYGNFNLYNALAACSEHLEGFGGHALAAGLNIRRDAVDTFRSALKQYYLTHKPEPEPDVKCDLLVRRSSLLSVENVQELELLEPYGNGNPKPVLCLSGVLLESAYNVGVDKKHLKVNVQFDGRSFDGIFFHHPQESLGVHSGDLVDIAFTPQINSFMGHSTVQLMISGIRHHDPNDLCRHLLAGESSVCWAAADYTPERKDFIRIWREFGPVFSVPSDLQSVLALCPAHMSKEQFCICLSAFYEAGLLVSDTGSIYNSHFETAEEKADLEATEIMRSLRSADR